MSRRRQDRKNTAKSVFSHERVTEDRDTSTIHVTLTKKEHAVILGALRRCQATEPIGTLTLPGEICGDYHITAEFVDDLCEKLNLAE